MNPQRQPYNDQGRGPEDRPGLQALEGGGQTSEPRQGQLSAAPENQVYDQNDSSPVTRPNLRALEGGGDTSEPRQGHLRDTSDSGNGSSFNFNKDGDKRGGALGGAAQMAAKLGVGGPAGTVASAAGSARNLFLGSRRRKQATVGGSILGIVAVGGIFMFIVASGPAEMVQLSEMLQKNFTGMENTSSIRANRILGSAGAQDLGETRVGIIQRQYLRGTLASLSDIGIDFQTNAIGGFKSLTVDTSKLADKYPELKGMSADERQSWLADRFQLSPDQIKIQNGDLFSVDALDVPFKAIPLLSSSSLELSGKGAVLVAASNRIMTKYFDVPSLFHPISRALASKANGTTNAAEKQAAEEGDQKLSQSVEAEGDSAEQDINSNEGLLNGIAGKALLYTGGVCFVRSTASDLITINRARVVLPAVVTALNFIAVGEQIKSGQDITSQQVGGLESSLTDSQGQSVWKGLALQVTSGTRNPSGPDISADYQQAFSSNTTAATIENFADKSLGGNAEASFACSQIGQALQTLVSGIQFIASAVSEAATDGAITPVVAASWAARFGEDAALSIVGMHFLQQFILSSGATGTLAKDAFSGPAGGNLLAYGAREAANVGARAEGGVALAGSVASTLAAQQQKQDDQQFRSESFFARTFNIDDYRSLAGKLAESVSPSYATNAASAIHGFGGIGGNIISNLSSIFVPKSMADQQSYNWDFPEAGIPTQLLNDPELANVPDYQNKLTAVLDGGNGQAYIDKAMTCFGNKVSKDSGVWDVEHDHDPNPNDADYINANCDNLSDPTWNEMIMFNADTLTADGMACTGYNDEQACQAMGIDSTSNNSAPTSTAPTTGLTNPFPDGWTPNRLDMGYDGTFKNRIVAPFSGTITYAADSFSNWGGWLEIKADQQPAGLPTSTLYFAEGVKPAVHSGQHVNAGDEIASPAPSPYGDAYGTTSDGSGQIEWGLAQEGSVGSPTNTYVYGQCGSSAATQAVLTFSQWAQKNLGVAAPATTDHAGCP